MNTKFTRLAFICLVDKKSVKKIEIIKFYYRQQNDDFLL